MNDDCCSTMLSLKLLGIIPKRGARSWQFYQFHISGTKCSILQTKHMFFTGTPQSEALRTQPWLTRRSADQRWSTPINEKSEWPLQYFYTMVKIAFSTTRCRACHRKSQNFKFVIPTDWSTLLFSVRVTQSCKFASFKYKADGLMHAPPKLNSLLLVGDNYQLNSFQPTMGYQGTNVNFLAGLIGVFELIACFLILKLPPVTCKLKWRLILHISCFWLTEHTMALRSYYVRIINLFGLKCMVP